MRPLRRVLIFATVAVVLLCAAGVAGVAWMFNSTTVSTAGKIDFVHALPVPPLAPSTVDAQGRRVFELRAQTGRHDFGDRTADTWGFNGAYLGPTLRAARGEQVLVNVHNGLDEETTVHWHGMHLPARMDGGPHQMVPAGRSWSPTWTVDQPASTLWYHPHPHGETAAHVYRGLAGMFLIDDPATSVADLPNRYGVDDVPVIVQDKRFAGNGNLKEGAPLFSGVGLLGDTIVVNGATAPYLDVTSERVRLRVLNASNARVFDFGFADDREFALVGTDGGLLDQPYRMNRVMLSPGERAEIVVDVRPGERPVLRSYPPDMGADAWQERFNGGEDTFDVLQLRAADRLAERPELPATLVDTPRLDPAQAAQTRSFTFSGTRINGDAMDMDRIDATVTKGTTEVWEVRSQEALQHNFHVHDVQFQVLDVDGRQPPPQLSGWKDTIYLYPNRQYRIIARFADHADPDTPYMYHCHILFHEDEGMMGQFVVVEPGQRAGTPGGGHDHGGQGAGHAAHQGHGG
ncbi:multicopper oxidase family protein [Micromonospora cathayae]|uniref:Multicopper oxidase domain-containing protein n=1 Tax=Micromonospora cathayae TaxID=3028804 RepID=A0ABY7ZI14_9ACTN|nr:multicopper oxidase domain-containing protein [Micromonospora sp. HUAS 3]WDZ82143.1 multicopper oxidase domain-containing protein [Micromonospora sp. HUAS 3]